MGRRPLLLLLAAAALTGCMLAPAGLCETRADCANGLDCLEGVCAACRGDVDCAAWESCGADGLCAPLAGRCGGDADCAAWERCDASHACVLGAGHCADDAACDPLAFERCAPDHHCTRQPGRCLSDADCRDAWAPTCDVIAKACRLGANAGDDVLAWGTLVEGACNRGAVSRATTAAAQDGVAIGFDCRAGVDRRAFLDPATGALVYRQAGDPGGDTLRRFQRDALAWDAAASRWIYPSAPSSNDEVAIVAARCPREWNRWIMQGGGAPGAPSQLLYGCPVGAGWDFYGSGATTPKLAGVRALYAWNAGGFLLVRSGAGVLQVVSPAGAAATVSGLPEGTHYAYRTTATGFRVALHDDVANADELWEIDQGTAAATIAGAYAAAPAGYLGLSWEAIDAEGSLYGRGRLGLLDEILKRPLSLATAAVYTEPAQSGFNDFTAATFAPWLLLDGSFLFTRP